MPKGKSITFVSIVLIIIIATTIIDTSIVNIVTSSGGLSASRWDISFFVYTVILLAIGQYIIQRFFRKEYFPNGRKIVNVKLYPIIRLVSITMYVLVMILVFICIEMVFTKSYHLIAIKLAISISYGASTCVLTTLGWRLFSWLRINRNPNVFLYLIAVSVIVLNAAITIAYLLNEFSDNPNIVRPHRSLTGLFASPDVKFGMAYALSSIISFILMWLATAVLLRNYSSKLAKIKYWILIVLPLAYFLGQFQPLFFYTFTDFRMADPISFGIIYNIIIGASKPLGALLFGIAFWQISRLIHNDSVKKYLILSAYGMTLLFTSNQPLGLLFAPYPPFGLATICYMSLASYLILLGVYSSAISVANDTHLRRSIKKLLSTRTNLLDNIGDAEMKQQFESMIIRQTRALSAKIEHDTGIESSLDETELKHYIEIAIEEAKSRIKK